MLQKKPLAKKQSYTLRQKKKINPLSVEFVRVELPKSFPSKKKKKTKTLFK